MGKFSEDRLNEAIESLHYAFEQVKSVLDYESELTPQQTFDLFGANVSINAVRGQLIKFVEVLADSGD